jgi:hypothetical protein
VGWQPVFADFVIRYCYETLPYTQEKLKINQAEAQHDVAAAGRGVMAVSHAAAQARGGGDDVDWFFIFSFIL